MFCTLISVVLLNRFNPANFGKLFGLAMTISAAFSLLQYPMFIIVSGPMNGNPLVVSFFLGEINSVDHKEQNITMQLQCNCFSRNCVLFILKKRSKFLAKIVSLRFCNIGSTPSIIKLSLGGHQVIISGANNQARNGSDKP